MNKLLVELNKIKGFSDFKNFELLGITKSMINNAIKDSSYTVFFKRNIDELIMSEIQDNDHFTSFNTIFFRNILDVNRSKNIQIETFTSKTDESQNYTIIKYYNKENCRLDCSSGPSIIRLNNKFEILREEYFKISKFHREDGPAVINYKNNEVINESYYLDGSYVNPDIRNLIEMQESEVIKMINRRKKLKSLSSLLKLAMSYKDSDKKSIERILNALDAKLFLQELDGTSEKYRESQQLSSIGYVDNEYEISKFNEMRLDKDYHDFEIVQIFTLRNLIGKYNGILLRKENLFVNVLISCYNSNLCIESELYSYNIYGFVNRNNNTIIEKLYTNKNELGYVSFLKNGVKSRDENNGPAYLLYSGLELYAIEYWINGDRHRTNGPALEFIKNSSINRYYYNGIDYTDLIYKLERIPKNKIKDFVLDKISSNDKKYYLEQTYITLHFLKIYKNREGDHSYDGLIDQLMVELEKKSNKLNKIFKFV